MKSFGIPRLLAVLTAIVIVVSISPIPPVPVVSAGSIAVTLFPAADTFVSQGSPGTSYGSGTFLQVVRSEFLQEDIALLRFSLASIPTGATIASAQLQVYLSRIEGRAQLLGTPSVTSARCITRSRGKLVNLYRPHGLSIRLFLRPC